MFDEIKKQVLEACRAASEDELGKLFEKLYLNNHIFENWWYWVFQPGDIPENNHRPEIKLEAQMIQAVCGYTAYLIDSCTDDQL